MDSRREPHRPLLAPAAWSVLIVFSDLPDILWSHAAGVVPPWLPWAKAAALAAGLIACLGWRALRPLLPFALVMLAFELALRASAALQATPSWRATFAGDAASFTRGYFGLFLPDLGVAAAVLAVLWWIKRRRSDFFLVRGDLGAPIEPVRWLGIRSGESWRRFAWIFAAVAGLGVAIPTFLSLRVAPGALLRAAPLLPAAVAFAAVNAFTEEVYFRASLLATLPEVVGRRQAQLMNVALFGLAHWLYGSPPGLIGAAMTGFLAFLLGKAMLETRGLVWPWFIHFVPDVVIFASYAIVWAGR